MRIAASSKRDAVAIAEQVLSAYLADHRFVSHGMSGIDGRWRWSIRFVASDVAISSDPGRAVLEVFDGSSTIPTTSVVLFVPSDVRHP
jgi:hypothetical protein